MRVADVETADAAREVDEGVPVDVGERGAAGRIGDDGKRHRERRGDDAPHPLDDLPRARTRDLRPELDRLGGGHLSEGSCENRPMVLSDRTIARLLEQGRIEIDPYDASLLQPSSVDVRVDRYFRVFRNNLYPFIDVKQAQEDLTELVEVDGEPFILHPGEFVLGSTLERVRLPEDIVGRLDGKALALDTAVPTTEGWRLIADLRVGDLVFDEDGFPTVVLATTPPMHGRPCREVVFRDGTSVVADVQHQWRTISEEERR